MGEIDEWGDNLVQRHDYMTEWEEEEVERSGKGGGGAHATLCTGDAARGVGGCGAPDFVPTLLVECNRGRVLLQPETVVWATQLFSPRCYDLEFTVSLG